jgi:hypothetical protein
MHLRAFAHAAKLLTNALQVPESLMRWLFEARVQADLKGALASWRRTKQKNKKNEAAHQSVANFLREEHQNEMANA